MNNAIRVLMLGDIVGTSGSRAIFFRLPSLIKELRADIVIANAENADNGFGLNAQTAEQLFSKGIHVITSGNHIWQKADILTVMETEKRILRPANYPSGVPGNGFIIIQHKNTSVLVINLMGLVKMANLQCPFKIAKDIIKKNPGIKVILIDFHAEDQLEKEALSFYLDGLVSAVAGTHTHIQTMDEKILPKGTAFISDLGMVGPINSIIGVEIKTAVERACTQIPLKMEISNNPSLICGCLIIIEASDGKAIQIERVRVPHEV
jgi:hypothetical protein